MAHKLPLDLTNQRRYLRDRFRQAAALNADIARGFVRSLKEMAEFRLQYWDKTSIDGLGVSALGPEESDSLKLCLRFISDMNTSLAVPILARYWSVYGECDEEHSFLSATKAVTAFLALRRSVTGGTGRIDSDFRRLMGNTPNSGGASPLHRPTVIQPHTVHRVPQKGTAGFSKRTENRCRRQGVMDGEGEGG